MDDRPTLEEGAGDSLVQQPHLQKEESKVVETNEAEGQVEEQQVWAALRHDKGNGVHLVTWTIEDLTQKGDNYTCAVKRLNVTFSQDDQHHHQVSYVAKIQQIGIEGLMKSFSELSFKKECLFYGKILPLLNAELQEAKLEPLRLPQCHYYSCEENKGILILEDLSKRGFKMADRKHTLDAAHAELLFRELARIHASSYLLQAHLASSNLAEEYILLATDWHNYSETAEAEVNPFMQGDTNVLVTIAETEGYDELLPWLKDLASRPLSIFKDHLKTVPPFAVLCHGDCWINNFLFRYDSADRPVDVRLLDLQVCRRGSPALDLTTLVYTSFSREVRSPNLHHFLHVYLASFTDVVIGRNNTTVPFTYDELLKEYQEKITFGVLMGAGYLPLVLADASDAPDIKHIVDEEEWAKQREADVLELLTRNHQLLRRMRSILDDVVEFGVAG